MLEPVRGRLKSLLGGALAKKQPAPSQPIDLSTVDSAVIIRPNCRIGNTLFLLPLLDALARLKPGRWVSLAVGNEPVASDLLGGHPAVKSIVAIPRLGQCSVSNTRPARRLLGTSGCQLVIDPTSNSTTSRILMSLSRARFKLGFHAPDQWLRLTHVVPLPAAPTTAWQLPLELLSQVAGFQDLPSKNAALKLPLSMQERAHGMEMVHAAGITTGVVGFFCGARGDKQLPEIWWTEWLKEFEYQSKLTVVQILPDDLASPLRSDLPTLKNKSLRGLAAMLGHLHLFVSCDTGPLHLASAAGAPVSALFSATDSAFFGPQGPKNQVIEMQNLSIQEIVKAQCQHLALLAQARPGLSA